jgi:hypothetical protein
VRGSSDTVVVATRTSLRAWRLDTLLTERSAARPCFSTARDGERLVDVAAAPGGKRIASITRRTLEVHEQTWDLGYVRCDFVSERPLSTIDEVGDSIAVRDVRGREHRFEVAPRNPRWLEPNALHDEHALPAWSELEAAILTPAIPELVHARTALGDLPDPVPLDAASGLRRHSRFNFAERCTCWAGWCEAESDSGGPHAELCGRCGGVGVVPAIGAVRKDLLLTLASDPAGVVDAELAAEEATVRLALAFGDRECFFAWLPEVEAYSLANGDSALRVFDDRAGASTFDARLWIGDARRDFEAALRWREGGPVNARADNRHRGIDYRDLRCPFDPLVAIWRLGYGVRVFGWMPTDAVSRTRTAVILVARSAAARDRTRPAHASSLPGTRG